jgi:hypothetical protein
VEWSPEVVDPPARIRISCEVFHDVSEDGTRQPGEPPLPGITLTNGVALFETDPEGRAELQVDRRIYRFATLIVPAGWWPTTSWYEWVPPDRVGPVVATFGLRSFPETAEDPVRWVHISDTQTQSWGEAPDVEGDLAEINALLEPPLFLVNTGDLVEVGADTTHGNHYLDQLATSAVPVFNVPGNHDAWPPVRLSTTTSGTWDPRTTACGREAGSSSS